MGQKITFSCASEMPMTSISLGDTSFNKTGSWRYLRPVRRDCLAPCQATCPAGTDIPHVIQLISEGKSDEAYRVIRRSNPLPGVLGRVCYHRCESACNRISIDQAVSVRALERFAAEAARELPTDIDPIPVRSERAAVIGSGPAGLSCAYFLAREGVQVTVYDSASEPGGMLRLGIPEYRLPREVLQREIESIRAIGVEFVLGCRIGEDKRLSELRDAFDAVFVATGAHRSRALGIPGEDNPLVMPGLAFLKSANSGQAPRTGNHCLVVGGGNTAMDSARMATRLGAQVTILYRRDREQMPAHEEEVEEAEKEGVRFLLLATPIEIKRHKNRLRVRCVRMRLGDKDRSGRLAPVPVPDSDFSIDTDFLITAIGEKPQLPDGLEQFEEPPSRNGRVRQGGNLFVGGDACTGPSTVIDAVASGREAAWKMMRFVDDRWAPPYVLPAGQPVGPDKLNFSYFPGARRQPLTAQPVTDRITNFGEIMGGFTAEQALAESRRCLSCGTCNQCDTCWVYCPDAAILKVNGDYEINLDSCKGCGICAEECPRGVITLVQEVV